jgi:hypothetical protein
MELRPFIGLELPGGVIIRSIELTETPMIDPIGRDAVAQTRVVGREFHLTIRANLSPEELSITLHHEVLEATAVASPQPPEQLMDFNEAAFEGAAREAHGRWGSASPETLRRMLLFHGFHEN